jgi:type I restriction enzyme, S subunit
MPTNNLPMWPSFALTDVFDVRSGLSKPATEFGSGYPFLTFKDVLDNYFLPETLGSLVRSTETERILCDVRRGDVFLTRTSETQEELGMSSVALRDYEGATFNGFTKRLRPKNPEQIVPEYAAYYLRGPHFRNEMNAFSSLSTRASLNNDMLGRLRIVLPEPKVQEEIGYTLRSLDEKIEQNRRTVGTLEELANATFKAWFVDFEPVKAKAAGQTSFPGMPPVGFAALPDTLINCRAGQAPQGWQMGSFGSVMSEHNVRNRREQVHLVLSAVSSGQLVASDEQFSKRVYSKSLTAYKIVDPGAVAFNPSRVNIGSIGINHRHEAGVVSPVYVVCMMPREFEWFFEFYLRLPAARERFATLSSGSVRQSLRASDFLSIDLVIPDPLLLRTFNGWYEPIRTLSNALVAESSDLAVLRDYLLPRLLSGQVRVRDAGEIRGKHAANC